MMKPISVKLEDISLDTVPQTRANLDSDTVKNYAEAASLPPVVLFRDGPYLHLADGRHRYGATKLKGDTSILAEIREGTVEDALLYALGANAEHGRPRSNEDKIHLVQVALEKYPDRSNNWIAETCRVGAHFVQNVRVSSTVRAHSSKRTGKDGKVRQVKEREPGDDTEAERDQRRRQRAQPKNGSPVTTLTQFHEYLSRALHEVNELCVARGLVDPKGRPSCSQRTEIDRHLHQAELVARAWSPQLKES